MVGPSRLHHDDPQDGSENCGVWRFVMHGPDGRDYQNKITFTEVVSRAGWCTSTGGPATRKTATSSREFPRDGDFRGGGGQDAPRNALGVPVRQWRATT